MTRKGLDVSHRDVSDIAYPQHDVLNILRCFANAQHDKRGHDSRHSEGVLQSKTTEESNK